LCYIHCWWYSCWWWSIYCVVTNTFIIVYCIHWIIVFVVHYYY
jgi:hypothetical protein